MAIVNKLMNSHLTLFVLKVKRSVAWILRVGEELLQRVRDQTSDQPKSSPAKYLIVQDLDNAEQAVLVLVQRQAFAWEIDSLTQGTCHPKSSIRKLDPTLDDGHGRVGDRLQNAVMPAENKHPIIVPKNSYVLTLILRQIHHDLNPVEGITYRLD